VEKGTKHRPYSPQLGNTNRGLNPVMEEIGIAALPAQRRTLKDLLQSGRIEKAERRVPGHGNDRWRAGLRSPARLPYNWSGRMRRTTKRPTLIHTPSKLAENLAAANMYRAPLRQSWPLWERRPTCHVERHLLRNVGRKVGPLSSALPDSTRAENCNSCAHEQGTKTHRGCHPGAVRRAPESLALNRDPRATHFAIVPRVGESLTLDLRGSPLMKVASIRSRDAFFVSHSQTTIGFHPAACRSRSFRSSRLAFF